MAAALAAAGASGLLPSVGLRLHHHSTAAFYGRRTCPLVASAKARSSAACVHASDRYGVKDLSDGFVLYTFFSGNEEEDTATGSNQSANAQGTFGGQRLDLPEGGFVPPEYPSADPHILLPPPSSRFCKRSPIPAAKMRARIMSEKAAARPSAPSPKVMLEKSPPTVPRPPSKFVRQSPLQSSLYRSAVAMDELKKRRELRSKVRRSSSFSKRSPIADFKFRQVRKQQELIVAGPVELPQTLTLTPPRLPSHFKKRSPVIDFKLRHPDHPLPKRSPPLRRPPCAFQKQSPVLAWNKRSRNRPLRLRTSPSPRRGLETAAEARSAKAAPTGWMSEEDVARPEVLEILADESLTPEVRKSAPGHSRTRKRGRKVNLSNLSLASLPVVPSLARPPSEFRKRSPVASARLRSKSLTTAREAAAAPPRRRESAFKKQSPIIAARTRGARAPNGRWLGQEPKIFLGLGDHKKEKEIQGRTGDKKHVAGEAKEEPVFAAAEVALRSIEATKQTDANLVAELTDSHRVILNTASASPAERTLPRRQPSRFQKRRRPLPVPSSGIPPSKLPIQSEPNGTVVHNKIPIAQPLTPQSPALMEGWSPADGLADGLNVPQVKCLESSMPVEEQQLKGSEERSPGSATKSDFPGSNGVGLPDVELDQPLPTSVLGDTEAEPGQWTQNSLSGCKVTELRDLAKSLGLKGFSKLKKAELIALLLEKKPEA